MGGAVELEEALGAFATTVEVDGAERDWQLVAELGNICGEEATIGLEVESITTPPDSI